MMTNATHSYFSAIQAQDLELGTADIANFGNTLDGIYFYQNKAKATEFMSVDAVTRSLHRVIAEHYQFLVGRPAINAAGKAVMRVDPENLNIPSVNAIDIAQPASAFFATCPNGKDNSSPVRFFDIGAFYSKSGCSKLPRATYNQDHSAVQVAVLRFKCSEYVALFYSVSHGLFDATGIMDFMNNWAEYARNIDNDQFQLSSPPLHDRKLIYEDVFDSVKPESLEYIRHFREDLPPLPMEFPKNIAPLLIRCPDSPGFEEQHLLHISAANLERMRMDIDPKQTTNNVLGALLLKGFLQANAKVFSTLPQITYVMLPYDSRFRSSIPRLFSGNSSFTAISVLPGSHVATRSYKEIAGEIKDLSLLMSSGHTKTVIDTIENDLGVLYKFAYAACNSERTSFVGISNVRHMPFYTIDFGYGAPEILSFDHYTKEGMVRMCPNKQDGGVDLFINYPDANFEQLKTIDDLMRYVDVIF